MSSPSSYFDDSNFYSMIFGTGTNFWLASRYVDCRSYAAFGLRNVNNNSLGGDSALGGDSLFFSHSRGLGNYDCLAPVVSLGSGIQIKSGEGTTEKPYVIGK